MKKLFILSLVVAFALLGAQAFASPPIKPPVEGFIIESYTLIDCQGDVTENESYSWRYFEGEGMLANRNVTLGMAAEWLLDQYAALNAIDPVQWPAIPALTQNYIDFILAHAGDMILLQNLGFQEGAEIIYSQEFTALNGTTHFEKDFKAVSHTNDTDTDNLVVEKTINYEAIDASGAPTTGNATHEEKVGLNVVSVGSAGGDNIAADARSLLSLCPWTTTSGGVSGGYPPTNEGIAAGNEFNVTKINFNSKTRVNSSDNPALSHEVVADGEGFIAAGFIVDLWEGRQGDIWSTYQPHQPWLDLITDIHAAHGIVINLHPDIVWVQEGEPFLASRTQYEEHASADGVWSFTKKVSYESVMTGGTAPSSTIPINNVP